MGVTLQNVDQAMTTKYIIDIIANAESNVENNIEKFPSKNLDETSTDPNSRMAKILLKLLMEVWWNSLLKLSKKKKKLQTLMKPIQIIVHHHHQKKGHQNDQLKIL